MKPHDKNNKNGFLKIIHKIKKINPKITKLWVIL